MKNLVNTLMLLAAVSIALVSCQPQTVAPEAAVDSDMSEVVFMESSVPHPELHPICQIRDSSGMITESGSNTIDYCPGNSAECNTGWGKVVLLNGNNAASVNTFAMRVRMAYGWYVTGMDYKLGIDYTSDFNVNNGVPQIDASWTSKTVSPAINAWEFWLAEKDTPTDPNAAPDNCFAVSIRLQVAKRDFFNGIDQNSTRYIWVNNEQFLNGPDFASSQFIQPYCNQYCNSNSLVDQETY